MLCTTRQACTRSIVSSIPQALPAESSRQAILRAAASAKTTIRCVQSDSRKNSSREFTSTKKARGISSGVKSNSALALAEDNRYHPSSSPSRYSWEDLIDQDKSPDRQNSSLPYSDEYDLEPNSTKQKPEWLDSWLYSYDLDTLPPSPLPPLETFRGLIYSQPLLALLTITKLEQSDYQFIKHRELRSLMHGANRVLSERPVLINRLNMVDISKSLRILRAILITIPTEVTTKDQFKGNYFKNRILRNYLQLCARLDQTRLYKSVFQDRLREHINSERERDLKLSRNKNPVLQFDGIISDLSITFQWKLIDELFNPQSFPNQYYTSDIIAYYMQSQFGIHQPSKIPRIFQLYNTLKLNPTAESYNHLIQSYLEVGDLPTAREIVKESNKLRITDYYKQQLSILRGYRALGFDLDLEKRVLNDIEKLEIPLSPRLLNALIRLRMESEDYDAAKSLLEKFDLQNWTQIPDNESVEIGDRVENSNQDQKVKPNFATAALVFELYTKIGDLDTVKTLWKDMKAGDVGINDQIITNLIRALDGLNVLDQAVSIFQPDSSVGEQSEWSLPKGVKAGIGSLNYYIGYSGRKSGLEGIQSGLATLHELGVEPNDLTMKTVIDFVKESIQHRPTSLAKLVDRITISSNLKPTQTLLDSLMQSAINAISRSKKMFNGELKPSISENTFSSTAGLIPSERYSRFLEGILESLTSIDSKSGSRSLSNRLRFDSMTSSRISNLPSSRIVWNSLIQRGYKPDQRHFNALIRGYSDSGLMYQAQDLLLLADQVGIEITKSMWFNLLTGWSKLQRPTQSRRAYEKIKSIVMVDKDTKTELESLTAMIQSYNKSRQYNEAALLCYTDLRELNIQLDRKAIVVSSQALRGSGDLKGCLNILEKYGPALDPISRRMVKGIKNYQRKQLGLSTITSELPTSTSENSSSNTNPTSNQLYDMIEREFDNMNLSNKEIEKRKIDKEILDQCSKLLKEDDLARPIEFRRWTRLNNKLQRVLRRSIIGENTIKQKNQEWIKERKIHFEDNTTNIRGRAIRRMIRKQKRTLIGKGIIKGGIVNSNSVKIGQVGKNALKSRANRRRFRRNSNCID